MSNDMANVIQPAEPNATAAAKFDELIERLERAGGPSRELDCQIAAELGILDDFNPAIFIVPPTYRVSDDGRRVEAYTQVNSEKPWLQASREPLPYTSSIDAALMLVAEGWAWSLLKHCDCSGDNADARAKVSRVAWDKKDDEDQFYKSAEALQSSPAIALCIAALKARKATGA